MPRASFSARHAHPASRRKRSLLKPAFWMFGLCSLMVSAATFSDKLFTGEGITGFLAPEAASAAGPLGDLLAGAKAPANPNAPAVLITPSGELTPEQRAWLLEQARKGAPIPLDPKGDPTDSAAVRERQLEAINQAIAKQPPG